MNADSHYLRSSERTIGESLPARPAAVRLYSRDGFAKTLCLDFDAAEVSEEVLSRELVQARVLLRSAGLSFVEDVSPSTGRHIYVPLEVPVPANEIRPLVEGLALRFSSLDASPHRSVKSGCIRVPGSRHKSRGWQELVTPFDEAVEIFSNPNPLEAFRRLVQAVQSDIDRWKNRAPIAAPRPRPAAPTSPLPSERALGRVAQEFGRDGADPARGYSSPSEARMGVLCSLAASGWDLNDVAHAMSSGSLPGLNALYSRYKNPQVITRSLSSEWGKATNFVSSSPGQRGVRKSDINGPLTSQRGGTLNGHGLVRESRMLLDLFDSRIEKGRGSIYLKFVLRALLVFAQMKGEMEISPGCRSIAVATGLDHSTVARHLRSLTKLPLSPVKLVGRGRGLEADQYRIELSVEDAELARRRGLARGKIHALRPVFRALGPVAALVYESIERNGSIETGCLVEATGMSRSNAYKTLQLLHSHRMISKKGRGWRIEHSTNLTLLADQLGALSSLERQINLYRHQRRQWAFYLASRPGSPDYQQPLAEHELYDEEIEQFLSQEPPPELLKRWDIADTPHLSEHELYDEEIVDFLSQPRPGASDGLWKRAAGTYRVPPVHSAYWLATQDRAMA